ncbi:hypothetical protein [Sagittula sp. SSi028]|uniref:hypothetical protein n=1 Tax=Sagittula sp. SSi028 TaxID=3400636 RepID=UPI003AF495D5
MAIVALTFGSVVGVVFALTSWLMFDASVLMGITTYFVSSLSIGMALILFGMATPPAPPNPNRVIA